MNKAFEMILDRLRGLAENYGRLQLGFSDSEEIMKYVGKEQAIDLAIEIVQEVAEEYKGGWIACSERLPDVEADVLLSLRSLDVHTGFMSNTEGYFYVDGEGYVEFENVLAWQLLPEPFKESD